MASTEPLLVGARPAGLGVDKVVLSFGGNRVLDGVSLVVAPGEVVALIGANGAGKTTLFNVISGFLKPERGRVTIAGEELTGTAPHEVARRGVGRLFQGVRPFRNLTLLENVLVGTQQSYGDGPAAALFAWPFAGPPERKVRERARVLLGRVGLADREGSLAGELSFGQQKLLAVARLLAADPAILLLDEPASGVQVKILGELLELIGGLSAEGRAVLVVEHDMNVVEKMADRAHLFDHGRREVVLGGGGNVGSPRIHSNKRRDGTEGQGLVGVVRCASGPRGPRP